MEENKRKTADENTVWKLKDLKYEIEKTVDGEPRGK